MAKTLDIKRLAKGMSLQDKAKLLFADINRQAETSGLERILTPEEEDAIWKDAQKHNQTDELHRLNNLYLLANLLLGDIQTAYLNFRIANMGLIGSVVMMSLLNSLREIISNVAKTENEKKELEKKYITFEEYPKEFLIRLPNLLKETIERIKEYKIVNYQLDYVVNEVAGIDFLSDEQKKRLRDYENEVKNSFLNFKNLWSIFKLIEKDIWTESELFKTFYKQEEIKQISEMAKDIDKAIEPTPEDKRKAREKIDDIVARKVNKLMIFRK